MSQNVQAFRSSVISHFAHKILGKEVSSLRFSLFVIAMLIYGLFGSPTPDQMGFAEMSTGLLIFIALPWFYIINHIYNFRNGRHSNWYVAAIITGVYVFSFPLILGVLSGHSITLIMRDSISFLFLLLPLLLFPFLKSENSETLIKVFIFIGFIFALRSYQNFQDFAFISWAGDGNALFYLANSPAVLFSLIFSACSIFNAALGFKNLSLNYIVAFTIVSIVCLIAVALTFQRASFGLLFVSLSICAVVNFYKRPYRGIWGMFGLAILLLVSYYSLYFYFDALSFKNALVGDNRRLEEWGAVWHAISQSPLHTLFGLGLGGTFSSPAVGYMEVNFTHGLLASALLKTGMVGFIIALIYLGYIFKRLYIIFTINLPLALALFCPFIVDVFLYASFKSLEFGLLLSLIIFVSYSYPERTRIFR